MCAIISILLITTNPKIPAQQWLDGKADKETLVSAIKQADEECGSCGCELDPLYKRALELI